MKKVFLLLASALMGVATMAGNTWELDGTNLSVQYNSYGADKDGDGTSDQYQAGNNDVLVTAVEDASGNTSWTPAVGESFMISMSGTATFDGTVQVFIVDEREEASYWADLIGTCGEFNVTKGEAFSQDVVLTIATVTTGDDVALTVPDLVFGVYSTAAQSATCDDMPASLDFENVSLEVLYSEAVNYENPLTLTYKGVATVESDGYKYQGQVASSATSAKAGQYVNVELSGVAQNDIATLMYALVDQAEDAGYWTMMSADMATIASNIKAGDKVSVKFSVALTETSAAATQKLYDVFLGQDPAKTMNLYISNMSVKSSVTDAAMYDEPSVETAVEEVSNVAIENGTIYSAGEIVVYNVAGQVVATASQSLEIASLPEGVYFVQTAEGTAKISK